MEEKGTQKREDEAGRQVGLEEEIEGWKGGNNNNNNNNNNLIIFSQSKPFS